MLTSVLTMTMAAALGAGPGGYTSGAYQAAYSGGSARGGIQPVCSNGSCSGGGGGGYAVSGGYGGGYESYGGDYGAGWNGGAASPGNEPLFPYDSQYPWMHGYFQEMPAYGGFTYFRPFNYKHVMPQSQTAGGWGMSPTMPYSQQFWHRFQQQASMNPQMSDYRTRGQNPVARTTMPAPMRGPAMSRSQENIPASYTAPISRPSANRAEPLPRATAPSSNAAPVEGESTPVDLSTYRRFTRERSTIQPTSGSYDREVLPTIQPGARR